MMKYKKTGRYIYRNIAGEGVLVPVKDGICNLENMLLLNETSTAIWERAKEDNVLDPESMIAWLLEEYEVNREQAQRDVDRMIQDLVEARCLECS